MGFSNLDEPGMAGRPGYREYLDTPLIPEAFADDVTRSVKLMRGFQQDIRGRRRKNLTLERAARP